MRRAILGGAGRLPDILAEASPTGTLLLAPEGVAFGAAGRGAEADEK